MGTGGDKLDEEGRRQWRNENREGKVDPLRLKAEGYLGIAIGVFGFSLVTSDWHGVVLLVVAILAAVSCVLLLLAVWLKRLWLVGIAEKVGGVHFGNIALFLGLSSLSMSLVQKEWIGAAIGVAILAYVILTWGYVRYGASRRKQSQS